MGMFLIVRMLVLWVTSSQSGLVQTMNKEHTFVNSGGTESLLEGGYFLGVCHQERFE